MCTMEAEITQKISIIRKKKYYLEQSVVYAIPVIRNKVNVEVFV